MNGRRRVYLTETDRAGACIGCELASGRMDAAGFRAHVLELIDSGGVDMIGAAFLRVLDHQDDMPEELAQQCAHICDELERLRQ